MAFVERTQLIGAHMVVGRQTGPDRGGQGRALGQIGGPIGDRIGRKPVMWVSMFGVLPLSVALPFLPLFWVDVTGIVIGMLMASAFPAIVVYAQELLPGRVGMIAGLFFGLSFGLSGIGAAVLGAVAGIGYLVTWALA